MVKRTQSIPKIHKKQNTKQNLVLFGLPESTSGTKRFMRMRHDFEAAGSILSLIEPTFSETCIRECHRLGKFTIGKTSSSFIYRSIDATTILNGRKKLASRPDIVIKPDMTPDERKIEQLLLREHKLLIQSGTERRVIKLRGSSLYVDDNKYGEVRENRFVVCTKDAVSEAQIQERAVMKETHLMSLLHSYPLPHLPPNLLNKILLLH